MYHVQKIVHGATAVKRASICGSEKQKLETLIKEKYSFKTMIICVLRDPFYRTITDPYKYNASS